MSQCPRRHHLTKASVATALASLQAAETYHPRESLDIYVCMSACVHICSMYVESDRALIAAFALEGKCRQKCHEQTLTC